MKLKTIIEADLTDRRWFWKIEGKNVTIYGEKAYPSESAAKQAAAAFRKHCLVDRSRWPEDFR